LGDYSAGIIVSYSLSCLRKNSISASYSTDEGCNEVISPYLEQYKAHQSYLSAIDPNRVAVLSPDMKRVRDEQQKVAHENAIKAENERKLKKQEERERNRIKSPQEERWEKLRGKGKKLGTGLSRDTEHISDHKQQVNNENALKAQEKSVMTNHIETEKKKVTSKQMKSPEEERRERVWGIGKRLGGSREDDMNKTDKESTKKTR